MYFKSVQEADQMNEYVTDGCCFECGNEIAEDAVRYDGYVSSGNLRGLFLHPACAALVGQRLISDGFPRRHGKKRS
jgi:hypothetical protein